jgi:4-amino-4-deoxy-L-arabinose transferase-like glycosyltransferase
MTQQAAPSIASPVSLPVSSELPAALGRLAGAPRVLLTLACLLLLVPFLSKPLHVDDPMYVWSAEQIRSRPLDPYGFAVNWQATLLPMASEMQNPPLICYYLAAAISVLGSTANSLHLAMLLPSVGLVLGTYQLARELGVRPLLAAAAMMATPVFLLSASTVMSDVPMVCAYVWAIWFWMAGLRREKVGMLWIAAALIAVSALTKYFGITLFPLLVGYALLHTRRPKIAWLLPLLLPAALLTAYQLWTKHLYGHGLLFGAVHYATALRWSTNSNAGGISTRLLPILNGLSFTGACCCAVILLAFPRLTRREKTGLLVSVALMTGIIALAKPWAHDGIASAFPGSDIRSSFLFAIQVGLWSACGGGVLWLTARSLWRDRNADSALLACWIAGTFCFAVFVNWNVAGRSILPMAPAVAILAARRWTRQQNETTTTTATTTIENESPNPALPWLPWAMLAPAVALALLVTAADATLARTSRDAADQICSNVAEDRRDHVFFSGHWGFQQRMQAAGCRAFDKYMSNLDPGDVYVVPDNNNRAILLPAPAVHLVTTLKLQPMRWISTMRKECGSGFYSDIWGPLPFAFGPVPAEHYTVQIVDVPLHH